MSIDAKERLQRFGIARFNTEKFENTDQNSILVKKTIESEGIESAFASFCAAIPVDDALPKNEKGEPLL